MINFLVFFFLFSSSLVFAQDVPTIITTQVHESVYSAMINREPTPTNVCYVGLPVPQSGMGWFEVVVHNDTPAPVRWKIDGIDIVIKKPMPMLAETRGGKSTIVSRVASDRVVVDNGGADQESVVLNPHERCRMVMPFTQTDRRGWGQWAFYAEQLMAVNPHGAYVGLGVQGRLHSTAYQTIAAYGKNWNFPKSVKKTPKTIPLSNYF